MGQVKDPLSEAGGSTNLYVYAGGDPVNFVDPDGREPVSIYLGIQAGLSAVETGVEYGFTRSFGTKEEVENFSVTGTFAKNFAINVATFGLGGKAKVLGKAGVYAARQGVEIAGDTAYDVGVNGRGLGESLVTNVVGSVVGEAAGRAIGAGVRGFHRNFEVSLDRSGVYVGSGLGGLGGFRVTRRFDDPSGRLGEAFEYRSDLSRITDPARLARAIQSRDFEDRLIGAASDVRTHARIVPALQYNNLKPRGKPYVRFDGVDPTDARVLIDRKLNVTTKSGQIRALQRQQRALQANPGFTLRIEVPDEAAYRAADRALKNAGVDPALVKVLVVP